MSNFFTANNPKPAQDEPEDAKAGARAPLFPPREAARPGALAGQDRPPFAPRREDSPFAGKTAAGDGKPLFPPRKEPDKPLFGARTEPVKPLFPPRAESDKPLFGARTEPAKPLFGAGAGEAARPPFAAGQAAERPLFGKPETREYKPLFSAAGPSAADKPKPLFGSGPADSNKPVFSPTPAAAAPFASPAGVRDIKVSDEEFVALRDFLYQQCGIFIAENRKYLVENRLVSRLHELGLRSFGEYYKYLRFDNNRAAELNKLYEYMTTNETSFFRNGPQLDVFRDKVLLKVLEEQRSRGQKKLRIWSAGCSSGEEPYTLAMIIYEVLKQEVTSWDIKITANDLSLAMLAAARRGVYNDYAIRTTPPEMLARYFTKEGALYRIDPKLARLTSFGQINLNDKAQLQRVERSQIVFCRNVIIYFDDEMKKSVINAFYDNLLPGGYLLIGHSESLHNISRTFIPEHHAGSLVYRKQS